MKKKKSISIVISAFNEEGNVGALYTEICKHLQGAKLETYEII